MKLIPNVLTRSVGRQILVAQKNSPRILFAAGIVGVVGSAVLASRATLKLEKTLDGFKHDVDEVSKIKSEINETSYTRQMHYKNVIYVYSKGTYEIARLYAPAIIVGGLSITALTTSHVQLSRRNAALTAAYTALSASFDEYRARVAKEYGVDKERAIRHGAEDHVLPKDVEQLDVLDPNKMSVYARFFDVGNVNYEKNAELNRLFIQCQQNYANHLLGARGHVFLNEVYDMLGIERSSAGQIVGWVAGNGDNYIDFGMFRAYNASFMNGHEPTIVLDFNVDGIIYDKI